MKRPQLTSAGSINRMLEEARNAWTRKDFQKGFDLLQRASRLDPGNYRILLELGQNFGMCYDYVSAERFFEQAIRVAPRKTEAMAEAAKSSAGFANHWLTEELLNRATKQPDASADMIAKLADFYERSSRIQEASALADRALKLDPDCGMGLLTKARLERRAGRLEEAERQLRALLNVERTRGSSSLPEYREVQIRANYELGMVLDRQGRYDEAMGAFLEAKAMLSAEAPPLLARLRASRPQIRERQASITPEMLKRWTDAASSLVPPRHLAFLGGHPRSGTTLLEQVLDSHPDVVSAEETDIFFNDAFNSLVPLQPENSPMWQILESAPVDALKRSRANYFATMEKHLPAPIGGRLLIDKNPSLTLFLPAFIRIFPEVKILVALRDPRDVVMSCFMQVYVPITLGSVSYLSLEDAIENYTVIMGTWKALASSIAHPCLQVKYEDVVGDLESVSRRVLEFLGISWDEKVLHFDEHAKQKRVRSPTYADVTKPVFKTAMGRWRNYQKFLEPHLDKLEPFVKEFGY